MRNRIATICLTVAVLLGSAGVSFALPKCPGSPTLKLSETKSWHYCVGKVKVGNMVYVGEFKGGKPHGYGTMTLSEWNKFNKSTVIVEKYAGNLKDGKRHGRGTHSYLDGRVEKGIWKNDKFVNNQRINPTVNAKKTRKKRGSLPECNGSPRTISDYKEVSSWSNCKGTVAFGSGGGRRAGNKYVGEWKNGKIYGLGTYTWANGQKYSGRFRNNKLHGQGAITWANRNKYVGEFRNDKLHGQGTYTYSNGNKYIGEWRDGNYHGQGAFTYANGKLVTGTWENNKLVSKKKIYPTQNAKKVYSNNSALPKCSGSPKYSPRYQLPVGIDKLPAWRQFQLKKWLGRNPFENWNNCFGTEMGRPILNSPSYTRITGETHVPSESLYVGEWKNGKHHGRGTQLDIHGHKYVGDFKDGKQHGQGTFTKTYGDKYIGGWKDGFKHGQGVDTFAKSKSKYTGGWNDGLKHGKGTYTYEDGSKYVGAWFYGKKSGQGTYTWTNGRKYSGGWLNNTYHGRGTLAYANGNKYVGEFEDGKFHGQGTTTYGPSSKRAGDKYVGEFRGGKKHGKGTYTYANGKVTKGKWKNGKYVKEPVAMTFRQQCMYAKTTIWGMSVDCKIFLNCRSNDYECKTYYEIQGIRKQQRN